MGIRFSIFALSLLPLSLESRPVSYPGGSTLMLLSDNVRNAVYYHYSPTHRYSVGIEMVENKYRTENYTNLRLTYLLDRRNTDYSQQNLYFQLGFSSNVSDNHFFGLHGDWETRRWFAGFNLKSVETKAFKYIDQCYQVGVAPYLGDYGDLHTWIMVKTKKFSSEKGWTTYPVLKFFKGNTLLEIGFDKYNTWDAHLMHRF